MLNGTPVLDIKPYIVDYDFPKPAEAAAAAAADSAEASVDSVEAPADSVEVTADASLVTDGLSNGSLLRPDWIGQQGVKAKQPAAGDERRADTQRIVFTGRSREQLQRFHCRRSAQHEPTAMVAGGRLQNVYLLHKQDRDGRRTSETREPDPNRPSAAVTELEMEQTQEAEPDQTDAGPVDHCADGLQCLYCLGFLRDWQEAERAIRHILSEDPRSAYRRKRCPDKLYYFTVDSMHLTCWFDPDEATVEVLKVKPNYKLADV